MESPVLHRPAKAEALRRNAQRVYNGFPKSIPEMIRMGYGVGPTLEPERTIALFEQLSRGVTRGRAGSLAYVPGRM